MKQYRFQVLYVDSRADNALRDISVLADTKEEAKARVERYPHFRVTDVGEGELVVSFPHRLFSIPEAAVYLHKSERFIYDLVARGKLPKPARDGLMLFTEAQLLRAVGLEDAA